MNILFIGAGKMGGSILHGIGEDGNNIVLVEPDFLRTVMIRGIKVYKDVAEVPDAFDPDIILLAVKPWVIREIAPLLKKYNNAVIISIAAGKKISFIEKLIANPGQKVVRAMPNLNATIKKSITALSYNGNITAADKKNCVSIFSEIGKVIEIDETKMDYITAVSGGGPAYLFRFVEAMQRSIMKNGFSKEDAYIIAKEVICGSAELLDKSIKNATELKNDVTTPNGTTTAALDVMDADGFDELLDRAMNAAVTRSIEISEN